MKHDAMNTARWNLDATAAPWVTSTRMPAACRSRMPCRSRMRAILSAMGDDVITEAWRAGCEAWPGIELDRERFAAHVGTLAPDAATRFPADVYLAAACLAGVGQAITIFDREVLTASRGAIQAI